MPCEVLKTQHDYDNIKEKMQEVFDSCIVKVCLRCDKKSNTDQPWDDFTLQYLEQRLLEEIDEYFSKPYIDELRDIINLACFCYIAKKNILIERGVKILNGEDVS